MYYLVNVGQNGMAAYLTKSDCEGCSEVLHIQCSGRGWRYVVGWQWRGRECQELVWGRQRHWLWKWRQGHWLIKVAIIWYALCI